MATADFSSPRKTGHGHRSRFEMAIDVERGADAHQRVDERRDGDAEGDRRRGRPRAGGSYRSCREGRPAGEARDLDGPDLKHAYRGNVLQADANDAPQCWRQPGMQTDRPIIGASL
jgi:hypothetical protein